MRWIKNLCELTKEIYSIVLEEWSLTAFTDAIYSVESRYLLSICNLIG